MLQIYETTTLTPIKVAQESGYLDWGSQPTLFKHYPDFLYRYSLDAHEALKPIKLARTITSKTKIGSEPYYQLNTPSAGNLHPIELYVQIRGIKGIISGIYHVNALHDTLVLIQEIAHDGIEANVGLEEKFIGILFIVSIIPFRSEWKYHKRAFRYCYLDAGHQIGAIEASVNLCEQEMLVLSNFNPSALDTQMGFLNQEFSCAVFGVGTISQKEVQPIKHPLMQVAPTNYCQTDGYIPKVIASQQEIYSALYETNRFVVDEQAILQRRSTRKFFENQISKESFEYFFNFINKQNTQTWHCIVLEEKYQEAGVYKKSKLIKQGQFKKEMQALLVNQEFIKSASMIVVVTANVFSANELINSAKMAHEIQLEAQMQQIGFSGIGAFYDKNLQNFLGTNEYILYVFAIGAKNET